MASPHTLTQTVVVGTLVTSSSSALLDPATTLLCSGHTLASAFVRPSPPCAHIYVTGAEGIYLLPLYAFLEYLLPPERKLIVS